MYFIARVPRIFRIKHGGTASSHIATQVMKTLGFSIEHATPLILNCSRGFLLTLKEVTSKLQHVMVYDYWFPWVGTRTHPLETMMTCDLRVQNKCFDCHFIWVCCFVGGKRGPWTSAIRQLGLQEIRGTMSSYCNCCQFLGVLYLISLKLKCVLAPWQTNHCNAKIHHVLYLDAIPPKNVFFGANYLNLRKTCWESWGFGPLCHRRIRRRKWLWGLGDLICKGCRYIDDLLVPKTNSSYQKIDGWKMTCPFKMVPWQGTCCFSGG